MPVRIHSKESRLRGWLARRLVRFISAGFEADYLRWTEGGTWSRPRCRELVLLPLAKLLDRDAAGAQMVEECWWG